MKTIKADLLQNVVNVYDQTKTTVQGRAHSKVIDGQEVLGPSLNRYIDLNVETSAAISLPAATYISPNGRVFNISLPAGTSAVTGKQEYFISCHEQDPITGSLTYLGMIKSVVAVRATSAHVIRGFKVIDTGTTGWRIFLTTTAAVLINGGVFCVNNVDRADFVPIAPPVFDFAKTSDAKATYLLQDPLNIGVNQLNIASAGTVLDLAGNRLYVHNGVSTAHQYYVYDTIASLTYATQAATIDASTDRLTIAGHPYLDNDPVLVFNLTGGAGLANDNVFYVRNRTANDFQLSATSGGAAIDITSAGTATIGRAFGTVGSAFVHKTGNLPVLTGTLLANDSEDYAIPQHTSNSGQACAFFCTSGSGTGRIYLGRLSELTSGAVTWPSLVSFNQLGSTNQITTPTVTIAAWSNKLDRALLYTTAGNFIIIKQAVDNVIDKICGGSNNTYYEGTSPQTIPLGFITAATMDMSEGWLVMGMSTTGQRGNILVDMLSDELFDTSFVVTKVLDTPDLVFNSLNVMEKLRRFTGEYRIQYRTSGFASISGGWTDIPVAQDISSIAAAAQIQFKILFRTLDLDTSIHAQVSELLLSVNSNFEISDNWEYSDDNSVNTSPSRIAFRLKREYSTSVPTLRFRAYDLSNVLIVDHNSVAQASNFQYSTDNGLSWLPLGTIPNVEGTLIRYSFNTPPGVDIRVSIVEA